MSQRGFYQPEDGWVGDVIPYEEDGVLHLFYLHDTRRVPKEGMPWHRITTENLVDFVEVGSAIGSGGPEAADFNIYTGSIVRDEAGVHHAFYTGQNPLHRGADALPLQLVMHATSDDGMATWTRHPELTFGANPGYESADWRDPFVFHDDESGLWRMLITARHADGPTRRRGVIAQCTSTDLTTWRPAEPFWDPRRGVAHECPEVFQWGDWWYLVSSEFSDAFVTRYRMARTLAGPWIAPEHDTLDGRAYYAAKSASLGGRRLFFGWIASREAGSDDGAWQWAGTLSVLEAEQNVDGTLAFHPPHELLDTFGDPQDAFAQNTVISAPDGHAQLVSTHDVPEAFRLTARFDAGTRAREYGVLLRASEDGDEGYILRLEPTRGRLVFDRWPRRSTGDEQWQISGDVPFAIELERPANLTGGAHVLEVIVDGSICVATLDDAVVLSTRVYDRPTGRVGAFVDDGELRIAEFTLRTPQRSLVAPIAPAALVGARP
ncbi:glycoside hydrolase [Microbacterium saccharophilum]|uniref:beta-fructofuranosidase n=1 Tax=Microbacterium saccharophilum TaxID=1213358 RepID=A0A5C8HSV6_9MICO|nr:GH32 C-terminal domain-containing protein [Microbacterium saccharophilum]TXK08938.1 glycoside hydrolase [Microbacterium saccharophilum]GEP48032.1 beta-fructofuranosidase [Microbacterium saccharophilum]